MCICVTSTNLSHVHILTHISASHTQVEPISETLQMMSKGDLLYSRRQTSSTLFLPHFVVL